MTDMFDFGETVDTPIKPAVKSEPISIPRIKSVSVLGKIYEVNIE